MGCCSPVEDAEGGGHLNWNTTVKYVFFQWWNASTPTSFAFTIILLFAFSFLYEGLINLRGRLDNYIAHCQSFPRDVHRDVGPITVSQNSLRSLLYGLSYFISQVLMMIFMTFNGYFITALVLGRTTGFFFFGFFLPVKVAGDRPHTCCE